MDARKLRLVLVVSVIGIMGAVPQNSKAVFRTPNFIVTAPTRDFAQQVGEAAEIYRKELAVSWLGMELPNWYRPCPITVRVGQMGASGATTFHFDRGEVSGWDMTINGSEERILDSVLPHEINHTIFACYFRRPLPRWADEGAATMIEHESERMRQVNMLNEVMSGGNPYRLRKLLSIKDYPTDHRQVLTLYAQGYSVTDYLIEKNGKQTFLKFLGDAHASDWDAALEKHYGWKNIEALESKWNNWVLAGSPRLNLPKDELLAKDEPKDTAPAVVRGQTPETTPAAFTAIPVNERAKDEPKTAKAETAPPVKSEPPIRTAALDTEPQIIVHRDMIDPTEKIRLRGRRETLAAGWEPVPLMRVKQRTTVGTAPRSNPLAEDLVRYSRGDRDRPIFAEETSFSSGR